MYPLDRFSTEQCYSPIDRYIKTQTPEKLPLPVGWPVPCCTHNAHCSKVWLALKSQWVGHVYICSTAASNIRQLVQMTLLTWADRASAVVVNSPPTKAPSQLLSCSKWRVCAECLFVHRSPVRMSFQPSYLTLAILRGRQSRRDLVYKHNPYYKLYQLSNSTYSISRECCRTLKLAVQ